MDSIIADLENRMWERLEAEENITKENVELVMLDIGFSPVIPMKGENPCEVVETVTGKYLVMHPMFPMAINADHLKIMRYRYLSNRKNPYFNNL